MELVSSIRQVMIRGFLIEFKDLGSELLFFYRNSLECHGEDKYNRGNLLDAKKNKSFGEERD